MAGCLFTQQIFTESILFFSSGTVLGANRKIVANREGCKGYIQVVWDGN